MPRSTSQLLFQVNQLIAFTRREDVIWGRTRGYVNTIEGETVSDFTWKAQPFFPVKACLVGLMTCSHIIESCHDSSEFKKILLEFIRIKYKKHDIWSLESWSESICQSKEELLRLLTEVKLMLEIVPYLDDISTYMSQSDKELAS